jgi:hypothetical protein
MHLSNYFRVESVRRQAKAAEFSAGNLVLEEISLIQQSEREQKLPLFLTKLYLKLQIQK